MKYMKFCGYVIFCCILSTTGCKNKDIEKADEENKSENIPVDLTNWNIFRGDSRLTGRAYGHISDNPVILWKFKTAKAVRSSAIINNDTVYFGSGDDYLYALDLKTGNEKWKFKADDHMDSSPFYFNGRIYAASFKGTIFAVDESGKKVWQTGTGSKILGSANAVELKKGKYGIVTGSYDNSLYCLDAGTGRIIWKYDTENYINGSPAVSNNLIVVGGCDSFLHVVDGSKGKGREKVEIGSYIAGSAALSGNLAYIGHYDNQLVCVDYIKGKIIWKFGDVEEGAPFFSSPAIDGKHVVAGARDNNLYCIDRETGKELWKYGTGGIVDSSPVIVDNKVIFGSADGRVYICSLRDGKKIWSYEIGDDVITCPAVSQGIIIITGEDGNVYAFGEKE